MWNRLIFKKKPNKNQPSSHLSIHPEKNLCKGQAHTSLPYRISKFSKFKHFWQHQSSYSCVERRRLWNLPVAISENSPSNGSCLCWLPPSASGSGWLHAACLWCGLCNDQNFQNDQNVLKGWGRKDHGLNRNIPRHSLTYYCCVNTSNVFLN